MKYEVETVEISDGRKLYLYTFEEDSVTLQNLNMTPSLPESDRPAEPDDSAFPTE